MSGEKTNEAEILNPDREETVGGKTYTVREMRWGEMIAFIKKLSIHTGKLVSVDNAGKIRVSMTGEVINDIIMASEDLVEFLIEKSLGITPESFADLPGSHSAQLLDVALELNSKLLKKVIALGRHFVGIVPGAPVKAQVVSAPPTIS